MDDEQYDTLMALMQAYEAATTARARKVPTLLDMCRSVSEESWKASRVLYSEHLESSTCLS